MMFYEIGTALVRNYVVSENNFHSSFFDTLTATMVTCDRRY